MRLGPCALAHTVNNWVTILSSALYTLEELCLVAPLSVIVLRQAETIDARCASSYSRDTRRNSVSLPCLARSLMRLCHPSTSLLVRTAFRKANQALGTYRALLIQVTCTYWKRLRRPGVVALSDSWSNMSLMVSCGMRVNTSSLRQTSQVPWSYRRPVQPEYRLLCWSISCE